MEWDYFHPAAGDEGCLTSSRSSITTITSKLDEVKADLTTQHAAASSTVYGGTAGSAWRVNVLTVNSSIPAMIDAYRDAYDAIGTYRDTLDTLRTSAVFELDKLQDAGRVLYQAPPPLYDPVATMEHSIRSAVAVKDAAEAEIALVGLGQQRTAADDALVAALTRAIPAGWAGVSAAFTAVGIEGVDDMTPSAIAAAMVELSGYSPDTDALLELFQAYGDNEEVMSEYFTTLGGANTLSVIDALGDEYATSANASALELAQRIRSGLSLGSSNWSATQAEEFADDMLNGYMGQDAVAGSGSYTTYDDGRWAAMGYLFADPDNAPMGPELTIATATHIDTYERENDNPGGTIASAAGGGGNVLYLAEHPELIPPADPSAYNDYTQPARPPVTVSLDAAGRVFETLGTYPDAAHEFLSTSDGTDENSNGIGDLGEDRIDYWFGDRDWSGSDNFEGPAALWLGSQQVDGGPMATGDAYDAGVAGGASEITSQILWVMQGNESFQFDALSDAAVHDFVGAIAPHFDGFSDFIAGGQDRIDPTGYGAGSYEVFGSGESRPSPDITLSVLNAFLGDIAATTAGAVDLTILSEAHASSYLAASIDANGQVIGDGSLLSEAMTRINVISGLIDGSGAGATIAEAGRDEAELNQAISDGVGSVTTIVGMIPIANYAVGLGVNIAVGFTGDSLESFLQSQNTLQADVISQADDRMLALQSMARFENGARLYEALNLESTGMEPPRDPRPGEDPQAYINYTQDWYDNEFMANEQAHGLVGDALDMYKLGYEAGR